MPLGKIMTCRNSRCSTDAREQPDGEARSCECEEDPSSPIAQNLEMKKQTLESEAIHCTFPPLLRRRESELTLAALKPKMVSTAAPTTPTNSGSTAPSNVPRT